MQACLDHRIPCLLIALLASAAQVHAIAGSAAPPAATKTDAAGLDAPALLLDRVTWGINGDAVRQLQALGPERYLERQLHPAALTLPPQVQEVYAQLGSDPRPLQEVIAELEEKREAFKAADDEVQRKAAQQTYRQQLALLAKNAAARSLLRDLYSPEQLQEQMTWFWMNHFNVHQGKNNLRAMIGDYEENAVRPHALGKFRDLLSAVVEHPAMVRYLDNDRNAAGHLNENFARELMELHTLGVGGGYSQQDVQELARILTGVGTNFNRPAPALHGEMQARYVRRGGFEFNPKRHDFGPKQFLGRQVNGSGLAEVEEAIDRLSRAPATARFISRKIAQFLVADEPSPALVERMAATFTASDGDIAATLATLFASHEFAQSLGHVFKDPVHYVVSSIRLAYDGQPILNTAPMQQWLNRLAESLNGRRMPDGYALTAGAWNGSGQMTTRFEIARAIGSGNAGLFRSDLPQDTQRPAFPQLSNAVYFQALEPTLSAATRTALKQAESPQEWNTLLLSSPEWMYR